MSLSFDPKEGLIVVPTQVWGPTGDTIVRLAFDTGATETVLNWDIVVLLGYDPATIQDRIRMTTGSGVEFVPQIVIKKIKTLEQERRNFPILCHTMPPSAMVDGVLGLDYLRGCRIVLDLKTGTITVE